MQENFLICTDVDAHSEIPVVLITRRGQVINMGTSGIDFWSDKQLDEEE